MTVSNLSDSKAHPSIIVCSTKKILLAIFRLGLINMQREVK